MKTKEQIKQQKTLLSSQGVKINGELHLPQGVKVGIELPEKFKKSYTINRGRFVNKQPDILEYKDVQSELIIDELLLSRASYLNAIQQRGNNNTLFINNIT